MANQKPGKEDRERLLVMRYQASLRGDQPDLEARNELVEMHMPLIAKAAHSIHSANLQHSEVEELIQVGCLGMIEGLRRFNAELGFRVSTYCYWWIRNAIHAHIRATRWNDYVPDKEYKLLMKMHRALARLPVRFDAHLDFEQLALSLKVPVSECHELVALSKAVISIETPVSRNGRLRIGDRLVADKDRRSDAFVAAHEAASRLLHEALADLPPDEEEALRRQYFEKSLYGYIGDYADDQIKNRRRAALKKLAKLESVKVAYATLATFEDK